MAAIDLDTLSYDELQKVISEAQRKAEQKRAGEIAAALDELKKRGFTAEELIAALRTTPAPTARKRAGAEGRKLAITHQDPKDPANVWSGRGFKPKWLQAKEAAGEDPENYRVKPK
jgi:DNA-binding protein H-NS